MERKGGQPSQSVVAKLMGLDPSPPQIAKKQEIRGSLPKPTYTYPTIHSFRKRTNEQKAFKDVFEIRDSIKVAKQKNQPVFNGDSRLDRDNTDMAFIRQKFMEPKCLSTGETLQDFKGFNYGIGVLDSNKDIFLKFLEEPNYLYTRDLHDLKDYPPAPRKSDDVSCKSEVKFRSYTQMQKVAISTSRKPIINLFNHPHKEHSGSLSHKLKSRHRKTSAEVRSSKIVALKPNLGKVQAMGRNVSQPSLEKYSFCYRRHRKFQQSEILESHAEGWEQKNLFDNIEVISQRKRGSRSSSSGEITKQIKRPVSDKMLVSGFNRCMKDESSCALASMHNSNNFGAYQRRLDNFDYWSRASSSSSSCSSESSFGKEARKRLSERWRMTKWKEEKFIGGGSSSSGEMLAISDSELPKDILDSVGVQKVSGDHPAGGMLATQIHSEDCSTNLPRSSSVPASSNVHGTPSRQRLTNGDSCSLLKDVLNVGAVNTFRGSLNKSRSLLCQKFKFRSYKLALNPGGEENKLPVRKIHVHPEELRTGVFDSEHSDDIFANSGNLAESCSVTESMNAGMLSITNQERIQQPAQKGESFGMNHIDEVIEESLHDHPQLDSALSEYDESGSESLTSSRDAELSSPVSVLEHPLEENQSNLDCFQRVSGGLQGLQMQLQLLRSESDKCNTECETPLSDNSVGECNSYPQNDETLQKYRSEEDRDYSYLFDIIDLGIHGADKDSILSAYCSRKHPLDLDVFEKLEEKYEVLVEWFKTERRLLFDLISSCLTEILSSKRKLELVGNRERLIEEVWQMVVRIRKELSRPKPEEKFMDPWWLDVEDDIETIGREIESMLEDYLLEELMFEVSILCIRKNKAMLEMSIRPSQDQ